MTHRLAILSTHPIQYNAPLFRMLHDEDGLDVRVFFSKTWDQIKFDPDFQREVTWDLPLEEGYPHVTHDASSRSGRRSLKHDIASFSPHALLVFGWNFPGHLQLLRTFHGRLPIWFRGDSHLLDPIPIWKRVLRRTVLHWVYRHVDLALAVGRANTAYFTWCGVPSSAIVRVPHAIDQQRFQQDASIKKQVAQQRRSELGILPQDQAILFAGKLEPKKQPEELLQAWSAMPEPRPHVLIAGSGALEHRLKAQWEHETQVHFLGFQNQRSMPEVYRMADLVCLPSKGPQETWGLTINEAMACEIPCLVSDRTGCSLDLFDNPQHGRVVPWDQPVIWTLAMTELLSTTSPSTPWNSIHEQFHLKHFVAEVLNQFAKQEA